VGLRVEEKRELISAESELSVATQCELLGLARSSFYYAAREELEENLELMRKIDEQYLKTPFYGYRRMTIEMNRQGHRVNNKRVRRLMKKMGMEAVYPKPNLSRPKEREIRDPYLLRGIEIEKKDQAWSTDITYIPLKKGFIYLVSVMDWFSRYVLSWEVSNSLEESFCIEALEKALNRGKPEIFNSDQGSQFTSKRFTEKLEKVGIKISWDGRGRALDNVFIERLWRSLKYEEVYPNCYENVLEAVSGISRYMEFYNKKRPHQSLKYMTPFEVYFEGKK
jgi:putative transposase